MGSTYKVEYKRIHRKNFQCTQCTTYVKEINKNTGIPYATCSIHRRKWIPGMKNKTILYRRENGLRVTCDKDPGINSKTNKPKVSCLSCNQVQWYQSQLR